MTQFSIIIPCFNAETTLPETLDALRQQSHTNWHALCIDDGSTDATSEVIAAYAAADDRISTLQQAQGGPSRARNIGAMDWATGDIVAFCDADDIWSVQKLAQLAQCFANPDVDGAFGQIAFFKNDPTQARTFSTVPAEALTIPMLLAENPVCTMSNIAVRTSTFRATGGFDETLVHNEDLDWLIRVVGIGAKVVGLDVFQTWYRTNPKGLSSDLSAMLAGRRQALNTAKRFGHAVPAAANAVYFRYLARRALRLNQNRLLALRLVWRALCESPRGYFDVPKRGVLTLVAALVTTVCPRAVSRALFSH